ncbi:MAG: hypothetical protein RLY87_786 [Chloroflexota bacterium]|jgi:streptomycin 6-kinase
MQLPRTFIERMTSTYGSAGAEWCTTLPGRIAILTQQWNLDVGDPFPLTMNYVCRVTDRSHGTNLVLKVGFPAEEFEAELAMYEHLYGRSGVQRIAIDRHQAAVLLPQVKPGTRLDAAGMSDHAQARIIAGLIQQNVFPNDRLIDIPSIDTVVSDVLPHARAVCVQRPELFSFDHLERACTIMTTTVSRSAWYPLHADLHAGNVLLSNDRFIHIDPQGLIGPQVYECTPFIRSRHTASLRKPHRIEETMALLRVFATTLDIPVALLAQWCYASAVAAAWWSFQSNGCIDAAEYQAIDDFWGIMQQHV